MRWDNRTHQEVEAPNVDAFLAEVEEVCRKHGFAIGHEDEQGAFIIHRRLPHYVDWLSHASVELDE